MTGIAADDLQVLAQWDTPTIRKVIGRKISKARVTARTMASMSFSEA